MRTKYLIPLLAMLLSPLAAFGQSSATSSNVSASLDVYVPITVAPASGTSMNFGNVFVTTGGDLTLSPHSNSNSVSGGLVLGTHSPSAAVFNVGGRKSASFNITLPSTITLTDASSDNLTVTNLTASLAGGADIAGASPVPASLDSTGSLQFAVGGKITLASGQNQGSYSGSFNVTVAYQ